MEKFNSIVFESLKELNTPSKKLLMDKINSSNSSLEEVIDDLLFRCGMSVNVVDCYIDTKGYLAYINFMPDNIFNIEKGKKELNKYPIKTKVNAEKILANNVISMLSFVPKSRLEKVI